MTVSAVDEPPTQEIPAQSADAVIVQRTFDDKGNLSVQIALAGDVRTTETLSILRLAVAAAERQLLQG